MTATLQAVPSQAGPEQNLLRSFFRQMPSGVSVITAFGPEGPVGATVSSVCSLSLDPPLLLACLTRHSRTLSALQSARCFAVNLLRVNQSERSTAFARPRADGEQQFADASWTMRGAPIFDDALAWAVCDLERLHEGGDHVIVVARVRAGRADTGQPLVYHDGRYRSLAHT
jgi:flavin reductase (DIM6/NTAB) family NADH-FMN oxidoreductase RutF